MARAQAVPIVCSLSTRGARPDNQDREFAGTSSVLGQRATVLAVADGMGGLEGGEQAARMAVDAVREFASGVLPKQASLSALRASVAQLFQEANRRVRAGNRGQGRARDSGTTLVVCLATADHFLVAAAGDSRCYYVNDFEARQLTIDHTAVQELVERGSLSSESAERSPYRHQLTNCLGEDGEIRVDLVPPTPHLAVIDEPCVLLLCSDGLHGATAANAIFRELQGARDLETGCRNLLALAYRNGSTDNITVTAVEIGRLGRTAARESAAAAGPAASSGLRVVGLVALITGMLGLVAFWIWGVPMLKSGFAQ